MKMKECAIRAQLDLAFAPAAIFPSYRNQSLEGKQLKFNLHLGLSINIAFRAKLPS